MYRIENKEQKLTFQTVNSTLIAHDNTPYVSAENVDEVTDSLEQVPTHYFNGTVLKI